MDCSCGLAGSLSTRLSPLEGVITRALTSHYHGRAAHMRNSVGESEQPRRCRRTRTAGLLPTQQLVTSLPSSHALAPRTPSQTSFRRRTPHQPAPAAVMQVPAMTLLTLFLLLSLLAGTSRATPLDDDLRCLQRFLQQTSGSSSPWIFASGTSDSQTPACSLLQGPLQESPTFQVKCSNATNGDRRITGLILEGMNLRGNFPAETLGNLSALSRLSLYDNSLAGAFPAELFRLSELSYLSLSRNLFAGQVPAGLSRLSLLSRLDLSQNNLSGLLPADLPQLSKLRFLYLSSNKFLQTFPAFLLSLPSLVDLNLSHNLLQGPLLPSSIAITSPFSTLDLSNNNLSGTLPSFQQSSLLQHLDLSHNSFHGDVSASIISLPPSLTWLDLSSNKLTGQPSWNLSQTPSLSHLGLAGNAFTPSSCQWVTAFHQLQYLNLSQTQTAGTIPENICTLTNLTILDLSYNKFNGSIPSSFINLHNLTYLDLSNNNLSGDASVLFNLNSLSFLNYSFNNPSDCVANKLEDKFGPDSFIGLCEPLAADIAQNGGTHQSRSSRHLTVILGTIAAGIAVFSCCLLAVGLLSLRRRNKHCAGFCARKTSLEEKYVSGPFSFETDSGLWLANVKNPSSVPVVMFEKPLLNLTFADLLQATSSFRKESQLTEGGFGPVYRADLPSGLDVTIKVLIEGRILTDQEAGEEFRALSKIKHPNLVPLLGYCLVGDERLVIYQYMENGGLHRWLHDLPVGTQLDDWSRDLQWQPVHAEVPVSGELGSWYRRHKIALGIARALAFLHHGHSSQIVHRDVKASNVLLDEKFEPRLANTGLVGLLAASDEGLFAGSTPGYAPPEYRQPGSIVNMKGDVYSYGVVLLELVTGKRPFGDFYQEGFTGNLVGWVRFLMKEKRTHRALDPRISSDRGPISEMLEALRIGYLCTADAAVKRPTMQQVVGLLKDLEPNGTSL